MSTFCDPDMMYTWPFRVEDTVVPQHKLFLLWRGLRQRRGYWCSFLGCGENVFYYDEDDPVMAAEWDLEMQENAYEKDEEVQEAVRKMEDANSRSGLTLADCDEIRQKVRRLNQTVRGRQLGKAVAAEPFDDAVVSTERLSPVEDESKSSDDG